MNSKTPSDSIAASPVLKWAGGKRSLIAQYRKHLPKKFGNYYEPFVGGGAVFFWLHSQGLLKNKEIFLNDINPELINLYEVLRSDCENLIDLLQWHQQHHSETHYYQVRAELPDTALGRAARTVYLNRTCFNGLYRVNSQGHFNVPLGRYKNPKVCDPPKLQAASLALHSVHLTHGSYLECVKSAQTGDFVYFDPPYIPLNATAYFTSYTKENFAMPDQEKLAQTFAELADRKVKVFLSNSDTPEVRALFPKFTKHKILASRAINSKADRRQKVTELLIRS